MTTTEFDVSVESVRRVLRDAGLKATSGRIATFRLLLEASHPLSHTDVYEKLTSQRMSVDKATVFRNLQDLVDARLLQRTEFGDHIWRFEALSADSHDRSAHPHFFCVDCGSVSCLLNIQLLSDIASATASVGETTEVVIRGRCKDCR
jgi:Fur family transcriptional regulator, ferric uptake regulator